MTTFPTESFKINSQNDRVIKVQNVTSTPLDLSTMPRSKSSLDSMLDDHETSWFGTLKSIVLMVLGCIGEANQWIWNFLVRWFTFNSSNIDSNSSNFNAPSLLGYLKATGFCSNNGSLHLKNWFSGSLFQFSSFADFFRNKSKFTLSRSVSSISVASTEDDHVDQFRCSEIYLVGKFNFRIADNENFVKSPNYTVFRQ